MRGSLVDSANGITACKTPILVAALPFINANGKLTGFSVHVCSVVLFSRIITFNIFMIIEWQIIKRVTASSI